jgi:serine/threonine-protein kinase HipA
VAETSLLTLGDHGRTFVSHRFDRTESGRRLFASGMTMTGKGNGDPAGYPDLARAISDHVAHGAVRADRERLFRRLLFNVLAGNRDDHLRNHGFLRLPEGCRLAPAFDLNPARELREHALAVDGATTAPNVPAAFATHRLYGLPEARGRKIAREVDRAVSRWQRSPATTASRRRSRRRSAPWS